MSALGAAPSITSLLASSWQPAWGIDAVAALFAGLYAWAAWRVRGRWPRRRTASFLAGLAVVLVALQSGVASYDERLLSVHMVQHMLLLLLAPLLLLEGRPILLALRTLSPAHRAVLARVLERARTFSHPLACLAAFSAAIVLAHVPPVYEATLRHPLLHELEHALFIGAGLLFWWPLLGADPLPTRRLGGVGRVVYLLGAMPAMAAVGAYLNRAPAVVYGGYAAPARALGVSAVADQQQAGAIMWVGGSTFVIVVGLCVAMAAMIGEERRQSARERRARAGQRLREDAIGSGP